MYATGFQILFLYFAVIFGSMLASRWLSDALAWPSEWFGPISQAVMFLTAGFILIAISPMRRAARAYLAVPIPEPKRFEVATFAVFKLCVPFALVGAFVIAGVIAQDDGLAIRNWVAPEPEKQWAFELSPANVAFSLLIGCLLAPLIEEIYFRGFLYHAWERQFGWMPAMGLTSAAFGLAHPGAMILTFVASLLYIAILRRTGSLRACFYVHAFYNALISWPLLGHLVFAPRSGDPLSLSTWAIELGCLTVVVIGLPLYLHLARRPIEAPAHT